jgi:hypothetical protein
VTAAVKAADRTLALFDIRTMEQHLNNALLLQRASAFLFGLAGVIGVRDRGHRALRADQLPGCRQAKELAIRMAWVRSAAKSWRECCARGWIDGAGSGIGLLLAALMGRGISSLLYGVSPTDGVTFCRRHDVHICYGPGACLVPAFRAANVAPSAGIRSE